MSGVLQLLEAAQKRGMLSAEALERLRDPRIFSLVQRIFNSKPPFTSATVLAVTLMADNSGSIRKAGREQDVIDGTNAALQVFADAPNATDIYVQVIYVDGTVLFGWTSAADTGRLDWSNYSGTSGTPLYDTSMAIAGANVALAQFLFEQGVAFKSSTLLVTDGEDENSTSSIQQCNCVLVGSVVNRRRQHLLGAMGIGAKEALFRQMFLDMGIAPNWICLPGDSAERLMAFYLGFSKSSVSASVGAAQFSSALATGISGGDSSSAGPGAEDSTIHDG